MKKKLLIMLTFLCVFSFVFLGGSLSEKSMFKNTSAASAATYKVKPSTKPLRKYKGYNKYTKNYFMLRSYLEKLEKKKGGKLILKKGTYYVTNVLYIPSNVKICLSDGVVIKKGFKTGTKLLKPSVYMFAFAPPSKAKCKKIKGYGGTKNSSIYAAHKGKATIYANGKGQGSKGIDMIVFGHNYNCKVANVKFSGKYGLNGHYVEIDAAKNCSVINCTFDGGTYKDKEAINIDSPYKVTGGFSGLWSSLDQTGNYGIKITGNKFTNMDVPIGTHAYAAERPHQYITISSNSFSNVYSKMIQPMNWKNCTISNNTFNCTTNTNGNGKNLKFISILARGTNNLKIYGNSFKMSSSEIVTGTYNKYVINFKPAYHQAGSQAKKNVKPVLNTITEDNMDSIINNNTYSGVYNTTVIVCNKMATDENGNIALVDGHYKELIEKGDREDFFLN